MNDLKKYTVVGYYESTGQIFVHHVHAEDESAAVVECYRNLKNETDPDTANPDDLCLVEIFEGHLKSVRDDAHVCCFSDWPGITE